VDDLVRLVYASEAAADSNNTGQGIELDVRQILTESRSNNAQTGVGGVLYYDNGYFFQCLEGQRDAVMATYQRTCNDPRHKNTQLLLNSFTTRRLFQEGSMKYLPAGENVCAFLAQHNLTEFAPFYYDREMVGRLLIFFQQAKELVELAEKVTEKNQEIPSPEPKTGWRRLFGH
jgi:hypothetical protein